MKHILSVIGARPQIIKQAAVSRARQYGMSKTGEPFAEHIEIDILHTGQHYDNNMSQVFFQELGIEQETFNLHVGSAPHGIQTAKMLEGIEQVLQAKHYDGVLLYGDTNSTLAGAVAAGKLQVPVMHVEAGLRSFNMTMPEEQNRIVTDHLSSMLFAPTETAIRNLEREGLTTSPANFANGQQRIVSMTGDVMYDNALYFSSLAATRSNILEDLKIKDKTFILATIHRPVNTDDPQRLHNITSALLTLAQQGCHIVFPIHPRTKKLLPEQTLKKLHDHKHISIIPPVSFLDILLLEKYAAAVITDSGGVQKEAFFFNTPSVILRKETEWTEIIDAHAGILADADEDLIVSSAQNLIQKLVAFPPLFGNGHAADNILQLIRELL